VGNGKGVTTHLAGKAAAAHEELVVPDDDASGELLLLLLRPELLPHALHRLLLLLLVGVEGGLLLLLRGLRGAEAAGLTAGGVGPPVGPWAHSGASSVVLGGVHDPPLLLVIEYDYESLMIAQQRC
jgi:hypothetical protein